MITLDSNALDADPAPTPRPAATPYNGPDTDDRADPTGAAAWCYAKHTGKHGPPPAPGEGHNSWLAAYTKFCNESGAPFDDVLALALTTAPAGHDTAKITATVTGIYHRDAADYGRKPYTKRKPSRPPGRRAVSEGVKALQAKLAAEGYNLSPEVLASATQVANHAKKDPSRKDGGLSTLTHPSGPLANNPEAASIVVDHMQNEPWEGESLFGLLRAFIRDNFPLWRNVVTRRIELRGRAIEDADVNDIYVAAAMLVSDRIQKSHVEAVVYSNFVETYNPVTDYFESHLDLRVEGAVVRLANTIRTSTGFDNRGMPDPEFFAYFLTKWLIGIVASAHGDHSPLLLALTGGQNTGKTFWLRNLLPPALQKYYAESKLDAGKDDEILMTQKLVICDDEMGGKSKRDETRLKELTSKAVFTLREPYGRANVDLRRLAVLCGTSNSADLLNDPTGNRRIIPVNVLSIDHAAYNAIRKDEVLMEAYHLWKMGYTHHLNAEDVQRLGYQSGAFQGTVSERELIQVKLHLPDSGSGYVEYLTNAEILSYLSPGGALRLSSKVLGQQLKALGFESKSMWDPGTRSARYCYGVIKAETAVRPAHTPPPTAPPGPPY